MSRPLRHTLILAVAALGTTLAAVGGWRYARASAPVQGPVILISIDTLRADHLPAYGYKAIKTPALDALAADGVVFERAYTHSTQTLPSHAAMMTGRLPFENGVRDDDGATLSEDERPLAQMLRDRGYATGGVVSSGLLRSATGIGRGFDFFDDEVPAGDGDLSPAYRRRTGAASEEIAERWLSSVGTTRLFLFLHIDEPRGPRPAAYDEAVTSADAVLGRFVRYLKAHQLYDHSTILLVSDHGEGLGDHGEQEHGLFLYNETIRVPLVVKPAAGVGAGRRVADVVQLVDVVPTVLDLVKAPVPGNLRGRSLRPLTDGSATLTPAIVYTESRYGRSRFGWSDLVSVTDGTFQYIRAPREELYNLERDPRESANVADADASKATRDQLRASLKSVLGDEPARDADVVADPKDKAATVEDFRSALALISQRQFPQAIDALQKIVRGEPSAVAAWNALADIGSLTERYDISLPAAARGVELAPDEAAPLVSAARASLTARQLDEATAYATQAIELQSKDAHATAGAHTVLALVALARYDTDMARSEALEVRKAEPTTVFPLLVDARLLIDNDDDIETALPLLEKANAEAAKAQSAPLEGLRYLTGAVLVRSDRAGEAETFFVDELRDFPHNIEARAALAALYESTDQKDDAARVANDLVRITPSTEAYAMAAKLWTSLGDRKQAAAVRADARKLFAGRRNAH